MPAGALPMRAGVRGHLSSRPPLGGEGVVVRGMDQVIRRHRTEPEPEPEPEAPFKEHKAEHVKATRDQHVTRTERAGVPERTEHSALAAVPRGGPQTGFRRLGAGSCPGVCLPRGRRKRVLRGRQPEVVGAGRKLMARANQVI